MKRKFKKEEAMLARAIKEQPKFKIVVDLDGTLAEFDKWCGFFHIGKPIVENIKWLKDMRKLGAHITIHTCRVTTAENKVFHEAVEFFIKWLEEQEIPYDEIWMATGKPFGHIYYDDHAIRPGCKECAEFVKASSYNKG